MLHRRHIKYICRCADVGLCFKISLPSLVDPSRALIIHHPALLASHIHVHSHSLTIHNLQHTKTHFPFVIPSLQEIPATPSIKHASIKPWCGEEGRSIVWRIYSICIRNCVQFTNSLFYNLVHLTAAGGQIAEGLQGANTGPRWTPNTMQSVKMRLSVWH